MPVVSIVIPAYNAENYLPITIDSVLAQSFSDWELVVVDDGSQDETPLLVEAYAQRDPRITLLRQSNAGVLGKGTGTPGARNRGFLATDSMSEHVIFLDADDVWEPDALEMLVQALAEQRWSVAAHGLARYIDPDGVPFGDAKHQGRKRRAVAGWRLVEQPTDAPTTFATLVFGNQILTPGLVLMRRSALGALPPFDPLAPGIEDWDLLLRLARQGPFAFVDSVVLGYRRHPGQLSSRSRRMYRSGTYVRRKLMLSPENTTEQRALARFGEMHSCLEQLRWVGHDLAERRFTQAARHLQHSLRSVTRFGYNLATSLALQVGGLAPARQTRVLPPTGHIRS